ncbi:glycosyltransferase involved in cell wall biosynthesis [Cryobacterium psychrophilum]|nr:glycosyltransferase involved in cell wall biosynthesis [Cryobacterium psychrophilum]
MRLVHYYRDLSRPSGVTAAIAGWQLASQRAGVDTIALHNGEEGEWDLRSEIVPHYGRGRQGQIPRLDGYLSRNDILVLHEGWITSNYAAAATARRLGIPYIVVPHGVYEPGVREGLKMQWSGRDQFERHYLRRASAAHIFYPTEEPHVRALAPRVPTFSLPTGSKPASSQWTGGDGYYAWFGRYAMGHKGIDRMLYSYSMMPPSKRLPLKLRGIDYDSGRDATRNLVSKLDLDKWVAVGGQLESAEKDDFLSRCSAFLFPSRWESQGIALVEALAMGTPCVVSDSIHMSASLLSSGAASVVSFDDFTRASDAMAQVIHQRNLSVQARSYVERELSWPTLGVRYAQEVAALV